VATDFHRKKPWGRDWRGLRTAKVERREGVTGVKTLKGLWMGKTLRSVAL